MFCQYPLEDARCRGVRVMLLEVCGFLIDNQNLKQGCEGTALAVRGIYGVLIFTILKFV